MFIQNINSSLKFFILFINEWKILIFIKKELYLYMDEFIIIKHTTTLNNKNKFTSHQES